MGITWLPAGRLPGGCGQQQELEGDQRERTEGWEGEDCPLFFPVLGCTPGHPSPTPSSSVLLFHNAHTMAPAI